MYRVIGARWRQGSHTHLYPRLEPSLPERFRGRPEISGSCPDGCAGCAQACPTGAIRAGVGRTPLIDLGACLFCGACEAACESNSIKFTKEYKMAADNRAGLIAGQGDYALAAGMEKKLKRLFGRSLKLRQVSAGGCNACEADTNVLNTLVFDLGRFGIQFVASPRHADGLLITGPVTDNMKLALEKTYAATPSPKIVIATGACAISGGPYMDHPEANDGVNGIVPVDLYIPGCPPNPWTILDGLLRFVGRI